MDDTFFMRLHESITQSKRLMEKQSIERTDTIRKFVGRHYADNGARKAQPVDMLEQAITIYLRILAAHEPRCVVSTEDMRLKPTAKDLEIALNQLPREIRLLDAIRTSVMEAMFCMGIVKVGISGTSEDPKIGDEPFCLPVQIDDYFVDMTARSWNEIEYEGNQYWMTVDDAKAIFGKDKIGDATNENYSGTSKTGIEEAKSVELSEHAHVLYDKILLRDVYLPRTNRMVTYWVDQQKVLRDVPWDGPEGSPYIKLRFSDVPGNLMPLAPAMVWKDLHDLANQLFRKLANQAVRKKTVVTFTGGSQDDVQRFRDADDGDGVQTNGMKPEEVAVGGVDTGNLAFFIQLKDFFSSFAGNLDALGGLGTNADTLGQDKLINESASARVQAMADRTIEFAREIFKRLAWYVWTDPVRERKIVKVWSRKFNLAVTKEWTPETRDGDFLDYNFDIAVFSMQDNSPSTRVQKLMSVFQNFILPLLPQFEAQGAVIDLHALTEYLGANSNLPELSQFIQFQGVPPVNTAAPANPQPEYVSTKAPYSKRVYERVNRSTATHQGRDAAMVGMLLGGNPQKAEQAMLAADRG